MLAGDKVEGEVELARRDLENGRSAEHAPASAAKCFEGEVQRHAVQSADHGFQAMHSLGFSHTPGFKLRRRRVVPSTYLSTTYRLLMYYTAAPLCHIVVGRESPWPACVPKTECGLMPGLMRKFQSQQPSRVQLATG